MSLTLVIVESPNKTKKIASILGPGFKVVATFGHFRDLPSDGDLAITFRDGRVLPRYALMGKVPKAIAEMKALAKTASRVLVASDPDREGEAIAWHVAEHIRVPCQRVKFHAITAAEVKKAVASPGAIDLHLVNAQQARRVLDRVIGWLVSPVLSSGLKGRLSAGRVQSVAVRLVADREREIQAFKVVDFFVLDARVEATGTPPPFIARLVEWGGKPIDHRLVSASDAERVASTLKAGPWTVLIADTKPTKRNAPAPFITSTIQQAASVHLKWRPKDTMAACQRLFEDGHITYHRCDSPTLAPEAVEGARAWIAANLPKEYLPAKPQVYAGKEGAQEAHEAIRPTHWETGPTAVGGDEAQLYTMIWNRFIASQMSAGDDLVATIRLGSGQPATPRAIFQAKGTTTVFDGWRRLTTELEQEKADEDADPAEGGGKLPRLTVGQGLNLLELRTTARRTKPPGRFTQASLIKALEKAGVGRPSTYASIMSTIIERDYVSEQKMKLHCTELGLAAVDFLIKHFEGDFITISFTRQMEEALDAIAAGKLAWEPTVTKASFAVLARARAAGLDHDPLTGESRPGSTAAEGVLCHLCGGPMAKRPGANGDFFGCLKYPKCKGTRNVQADGSAAAVDVGCKCPDCGKPMLKRSTKDKTSSFWGCSAYPKCKKTMPA